MFVFAKVKVQILFFFVKFFMHHPPPINLVFVIFMSSKTLVYLTYTRHQSMFVVAKLPEGLQFGCHRGCSANRNCSLRDWLIPLELEEEIANLEPSINFIT
jgi:hypothetical protein